MDIKVNDTIDHKALCLATAKRYNGIVALYEYKSFASAEEPDVLSFDFYKTTLFEIKISLSDFKRDQKKKARRKYRVPLWADQLPVKKTESETISKATCELITGEIEITLVEKEHLGNYRYYVCPWGIIPQDLLPEGWGLIYYKNGRFYQQRTSSKFRSDLKTENALLMHSFRRYASGNNAGIIVNGFSGKV